MTITWVNDSIGLNEYLEIFQDEFKNSIIYKNLNFHKLFETKFNNEYSIASKFTSRIIGLDYEGIIYCFYGNSKTISILKQEATEDKAENKVGFETIEKSFLIK